MSKAGTPQSYLAKAERSLKSAHLLVREQDAEGACNRAYYAMFDAANAALRAAGVVTGEKIIKTHHGLITPFSKELVQTGRIDAAFGKALNQVQHVRVQAEYMSEPPSPDDAVWAVEQAAIFVQAIRETFDLS